MTETAKFWLDWVVQALVAAGTLGDVYAALFGEAFKAKRVRLSASIEQRRGVFTPTRTPVFLRRGNEVMQGGYNEGASRYYQLRVQNMSKRFPAHHVNVWLLRVDQYANNAWASTWTGEIPLIWQHQDHIPSPRTIGNPANADVFAISSEGVLSLQPQILALNLPREYRDACQLALTVQIRSDEIVGGDIRIRVEWDGRWHPDEDEMERHV